MESNDHSTFSNRENISSPTILIVDDDTTTRSTLTRLLTKQLGIRENQIITAEDGNIAVDQYQSHCASLKYIFMDTQMPNCTGDKAIKKIRDLEKKIYESSAKTSAESTSGRIEEKQALVTIIGASTNSGNEGLLMKAGASAFVQKPYSLNKTFLEILTRFKMVGTDSLSARLLAKLKNKPSDSPTSTPPPTPEATPVASPLLPRLGGQSTT